MDTILIESDLVAKALLDLIPILQIRNLVVGANKSQLRYNVLLMYPRHSFTLDLYQYKHFDICTLILLHHSYITFFLHNKTRKLHFSTLSLPFLKKEICYLHTA